MAAPTVTNYPQSVSEIRIVGVKPDGTPCFLLCDASGKLDIGLSFDGTVNVGTVSFSQATPGVTNGVQVNASALPTGASTETTVAAILAKLIAAPATAAAQTTANASLASLDGKVATETTLAAILAKLIAAPATEATLAALNAKITAMNSGATVISSGNVTANVPTVTLANSSAYESSRVISASACKLLTLSGYNSGPAQFIQIFNSSTVPANGTAPVKLVGVAAQSSFSMVFDIGGLPLSTGCSISNSSTGPTKTIGSADCFFTATLI